jgi:hypothetical protein
LRGSPSRRVAWFRETLSRRVGAGGSITTMKATSRSPSGVMGRQAMDGISRCTPWRIHRARDDVECAFVRRLTGALRFRETMTA